MLKHKNSNHVLKNLTTDHAIELPECDGWPAASHLFEQLDVLAAQAAFAAGRPLLLRGEPGTGKTQFARAVAASCNCLLVPVVINGATELEDLFWRYDAVARLAEAQIMDETLSPDKRADMLDPRRYLIPGPLWWAFNWLSAEKHLTEWSEGRYHRPRWAGDIAPTGVVLLIDEIDKADQDLPNGLLEAFGQRGFNNPWIEQGGVYRDTLPLLTIVTTNEERELPRAFLRRCLVREIIYPSEKDKQAFNEWMICRARTHFNVSEYSDELLTHAAELIRRDREVLDYGEIRPGLAEYLDLLRAVREMYGNELEKQQEGIDMLADFVLKKQGRVY